MRIYVSVPNQHHYAFMRKRAHMAYVAEEAASSVRNEADQAVRVALQEVLQRNEEVENARLGAEVTAQQAMEMQAAAVRAAEEHVARVGQSAEEALQAHVGAARRAYEEELRGQVGALRSEAEQYVPVKRLCEERTRKQRLIYSKLWEKRVKSRLR